MTGDQIEQITELRGEFPAWAIQHLPEADLAWEAKRGLPEFPPRGGFAWIRADTAERLRELLGGAAQIEHQLDTEETGS